MGWFRDEDLDFVSLYFGEPDGVGHLYGPDSPQRREMVKQVDRAVGYIRQSAERHGLGGRLNLIITADHGMSPVHPKGTVEEITLSKIPGFSFKDVSFHLVDYGPSGMLLPKPGRLEAVYRALKGAHPHLHVYRKEEVPERLRFSRNARILPIVLYADPGYLINGVSARADPGSARTRFSRNNRRFTVAWSPRQPQLPTAGGWVGGGAVVKQSPPGTGAKAASCYSNGPAGRPQRAKVA